MKSVSVLWGKFHCLADLLLTGLDLAKQVNMLLIQHKQRSWIQTEQTGGQLYSDTFPYEIS